MNISDNVDYSGIMNKEKKSTKPATIKKRKETNLKEVLNLQKELAKGLLDLIDKSEKLYELKTTKEGYDLNVSLISANNVIDKMLDN